MLASNRANPPLRAENALCFRARASSSSARASRRNAAGLRAGTVTVAGSAGSPPASGEAVGSDGVALLVASEGEPSAVDSPASDEASAVSAEVDASGAAS